MMDQKLWEIQNTINKNYDDQIKILQDSILYLLNVITDHEENMGIMADKINELENKLSKYEES